MTLTERSVERAQTDSRECVARAQEKIRDTLEQVAISRRLIDDIRKEAEK